MNYIGSKYLLLDFIHETITALLCGQKLDWGY